MTPRIRKRVSLGLALLLVPLAIVVLTRAGKNPDPEFECFPVQGKIIAGTQPLEKGIVAFVPENHAENGGPIPTSLLEVDGSFHLKTFDLLTRTNQDGAPAGVYTVIIRTPDLWNGRYNQPKRSELRAEVVRGVNVVPTFNLPIEIEKKPRPPGPKKAM